MAVRRLRPLGVSRPWPRDVAHRDGRRASGPAGAARLPPRDAGRARPLCEVRLAIGRGRPLHADRAPLPDRRGRHIDLSHGVEDGMVTYKGLPAPKISDFLSRADSRARYAPGTEFQIGLIEMCSNTGTYVDSPFHRYPEGADLAGLELDRLADVDAITVDAVAMTA